VVMGEAVELMCEMNGGDKVAVALDQDKRQIKIGAASWRPTYRWDEHYIVWKDEFTSNPVNSKYQWSALNRKTGEYVSVELHLEQLGDTAKASHGHCTRSF